MPNIKFGSYTVLDNPADMTVIKADKHCASGLTYSGVAYFNWGASIVGKKLELTWRFMQVADFAELDSQYADDDTVTFDPQDGSGDTFTAKIMEFDGKYHINMATSAEYYRDCKMVLLILTQVT